MACASVLADIYNRVQRLAAMTSPATIVSAVTSAFRRPGNTGRDVVADVRDQLGRMRGDWIERRRFP